MLRKVQTEGHSSSLMAGRRGGRHTVTQDTDKKGEINKYTYIPKAFKGDRANKENQ